MEKFDDIDLEKDRKSKYSNVCPFCATTVYVITQRDNEPEYYTEVLVKCACGAAVGFELPVN